ncbi:hypothetical protein ETAA8_32360 [Anatilimnocola aggregata]|uniref:DUF2269 family protein n=1 Tax=Anatilimnocola aggregata TaxID=2528021 RepID=A0A517YD16_9BACT|nr:hypothetical protein [Anatilimnocola aggregata]QDU28136.1 hypothetical protein ETAA8_32360 [Anatilimnocola aggregata]
MDDSLFFVNLGLRYLHILGAIALMGGTIFMRFALFPTVKGLSEAERAAVHTGVRSRWAKVVGIASGMLLISGIANLGLASRYDIALHGGGSYSMLGGIKLVLALPIFVIAALLMGKTDLAKKVQANAAMFMNINLVLALILVFIGGWLKFSTKTLKEKYRPGNVPAAAAQADGQPAIQLTK